MTTSPTSTIPHLTDRRTRLSIARDLLVVALCALVVAGFLLDVARAPAAAPSAPARSALLGT